jgi:peptidoglycan/LPS O-acetylase OafA/YrhL
MISSKADDRLAPLDALRGLAALGVAVVFHYVHFGGDGATYPHAQNAIFAWLYANGWLLVDLFFLLSGVIITYRYFEPLAEGRINGREFFILRASRLYPLHLVTVAACAAIEWTLLVLHQTPVVYGNADLYHFFLQVVYLHPVFGVGWAFNAPSWSVGAEMLAYLSFFFFASRHPKSYLGACVGAVIVGLCLQTVNWYLARGLVGFYFGSLGFLAMRACDRAGYGPRFGAACLAIFVGIVTLGTRLGYDAWIGAGAPVNCLVVFPPLIFASLRVKPLARILSIRPLVFLGDIAYSIYLVHVPVQMLLLSLSRSSRIALPVTSPWFQAAYGAGIVAVATATRYGIEAPASRWLRRRFLAAAPGLASPAPRPVPEMDPEALIQPIQPSG